MYDVIITGAGPAGLAAGMYAARSRMKTLILTESAPGGRMTQTWEVENYPALERMSGYDLAEKMLRQAKDFGAELMTRRVTELDLRGSVKRAICENDTFEARCMIIASGERARKAGFIGEDEFLGRGVSTCAACDGFFSRGREALVVGGGNSAAEEALFLTRFAEKVALLVRGDRLGCSEDAALRLAENSKIILRFNTRLLRVGGSGKIEYAELACGRSENTQIYRAANGEALSVFVFVGHEPRTELLRGKLALDENGYVIAGEDTSTGEAGVFAAGDVRTKPFRQIVTAAADGAAAAMSAEKYIAAEKNKFGQK